ncbi:alpha/beta hydrolase [Corynebacterium freiburgense]|uniref:alpha/beta hydrolase n=1 Tax=Corynebacterium freiburgense TaxID=556548 RepID=UPI00041EB215|nr:alpha/beta hydrolase [Corynebacterium freiburgense]WJZ02307.1 Carboxylesterase NlhH [Corynebacterium freiburgense]
MKPACSALTKTLTGIAAASGIIAGTYLGIQRYRIQKVAPELRTPKLYKHPALESIRVWRRSYPIYAANYQPPRRSNVALDGIHISSQNIPGYGGGPAVPLRIYTPETIRRDIAFLWIHGGGFVLGQPEADDEICAYIARTLGCKVISPEYRLAGTAPFPAALHDCHATYTWLTENPEFKHIVVSGQSAGAGLAACLTQKLLDENTPPTYQLLLEPMLDDRTRITPNPGRGQFNWHQSSNTLAWNCYLSYLTPHDEIPDYAVAARRIDLTGMPPTFIAVGDLDLFYEEALTYARRLKEQQVSVESMILPGAYHGVTIGHYETPLMQELWAKIFADITRHTTPKDSGLR